MPSSSFYSNINSMISVTTQDRLYGGVTSVVTQDLNIKRAYHLD